MFHGSTQNALRGTHATVWLIGVKQVSKTALIVDDSRSARIVLKRVLETHDLNVDTAESAEDALEYLIENRPDAIFMDHMMPGMDGFEAVTAIKRNPQTATIPIMMYTSKKGEVYVGQARALGAVGVLPKGVEPVEVSKVLKLLRLIEPETPDQPSKPAQPDRKNGASKAAPEAPVSQDKNLENLIRALFRQQRAIIHHDLLNSYDNIAARISDKIIPPPAEEPAQSLTQSKQKPSGMLSATLVILVVSTLLFAWLFWHSNQSRLEILAQNAALRQSVESQRTPSAAEVQQAPNAENISKPEKVVSQQNQIDEYRRSLDTIVAVAVNSLNWGANRVTQYRFGEPPLGDEKLKIVEQLNDYLLAIEFSGVVRIETHVADFCLTISDSGDYVLADGISVPNCDRVGVTPEEALDMGLGQSVAFANFIRLAEEQSDGRILYEIVSLGNSDPLLDYPATLDSVSASDWNQIAAVNNRVVITIEANN